MSDYCGEPHYHVRTRGKPVRCDWCWQAIERGERYAKWLSFDGGLRGTVYAHEECAAEWQADAAEERGIVYACGNHDRPEKKQEGKQS